MIQDIAPKKYNPTFKSDCLPGSDSPVVIFDGQNKLNILTGNLLADSPVSSAASSSDNSAATSSNNIILPTIQKIQHLFDDNGNDIFVYLFSIDEINFFLLKDKYVSLIKDALDTDLAGFNFNNLHLLRKNNFGPRYMSFALYTAFQLANWYRDNKFCGTCGHETELSSKERCITCPECGRHIYPRICPAVIVGIISRGKTHDEDRLMMTKYASRDIPFYALIAGFTEIGETLEDTVHREVMEEVGLHVKNITYYKSQPWGIADDLLAGFWCEVDGDPEITLDTDELKEGTWMTRDEVIGQPDDFSLTNEMMMEFKAGHF